MALEDLDQVTLAERECFTTPWPVQAYRRELRDNRLGRYIVLTWQADTYHEGVSATEDATEDATETDREMETRADDAISGVRRAVAQLLRPFARPQAGPSHITNETIVGFAGMWLMLDEAHITTLCVRRCLRGRGMGELLLVSLIEMAMELQARRLTLEVRVSNQVAKELYHKYTFREEGVRRRYYSDNGEDAAIMWSDRIDTPEFQRHFAELRTALEQRVASQQHVPPGCGPNGVVT